MTKLDSIFQRIDRRRQQSVDGLKELLRIPSVSTQSEHAADIQRCAAWLAGQLGQCGLAARVEKTGGHPVVLATNQRLAGRPTVLLYGHYDVQPPEPLEEWTSPPFEPTVRDGAIYARGAADDKGQIWAHIEAMRVWKEVGGLPVNVIVMFEGEEEIGSANLAKFMDDHRDDLKADIAVISDSGQFARGVPAITYGLRGLVYLEVIVSAAPYDLHSGIYGGSVPNPANVLAMLIAGLHDGQGRVNIPGFYDDVVEVSPGERREWASLPFDEAAEACELNLPALSGEQGYSVIERRWARPTCDVNGLSGGYQGHGAKTIIPARASAKISMRLVPNQDPRKIEAAFIDALRKRAPGNVKLEFLSHSHAAPVVVSREGPAMQLAKSAIKRGCGKEPVLIREGGTIPVVGLIKTMLGIDSLLVGFGLPDDRVHSPNEKFDLEALYQQTRTVAALYEEMIALGK